MKGGGGHLEKLDVMVMEWGTLNCNYRGAVAFRNDRSLEKADGGTDSSVGETVISE